MVSMIALETSMVELGVRSVVLPRLKKLGITTVGDLLHHTPVGYADYRQQSLIAKAPLDHPVTLRGTLNNVQSRRSWRQRKLVITEAVLNDESGSLALHWFSRYPLKFPNNLPVAVIGQIEYRDGKHQIANPIIERLSNSPGVAGRLAGLYPLTTGITQDRLRALMRQVFETGVDIQDFYTAEFLERYRLVSLETALHSMHFPKDEENIALARRRLAFDELLQLQLGRQWLRQQRIQQIAPICKRALQQLSQITAALPFALTTDQQQAVTEIAEDIQQSFPMARLLQGEVGSGKTLVAQVAATLAGRSGYQTLYLAPTEVLAHQQYQSFRAALEPLGLTVGLLTSQDGESAQHKSKTAVRKALQDGTIAIVIGTHALLQSPVKFKKLGLVVVDEQHRFGVAQRLAAQQKGSETSPHVLTMTATPIPRTLQLAFLGDLDVSTLKTMPHGERSIMTMLFGPQDRQRVELAIKRRIARGEQVYVVCPLIDPSDKLGVKSATAEYERLRQEAFADTAIGLLHGKLSGKQKAEVLQAFRDGKTKLLVATTVVEVGVDIPNATVMVIEAAERFGLAQLHQLRGRVGRGTKPGVCVLFTESASAVAAERLTAFAQTSDGFALSELDLKLRGPGEWFGTAQSGFPELRMADLNDEALLSETATAAHALVKDDPKLQHSPVLRQQLEAFFAKQHLS